MINLKNISSKSKFGFTLVEILIVIAIIGILLGIILVGFSEARAAARDAVRMSDLRTLEKILAMSKDSQGRYPTSTIDFQIEGQAWGSSWERYGVVPKDPLSPQQDYAYVSDEGRDYQIYAKFEREPVNPTFACTDPCGPNAEYNGGITSAGATTLIAFEPPPPPPEEEPPPEEGPEPPPEGEPIVCSPPLASGEQPYSVSSKDDPKITRVIVNPFDVNKFATQTVSVLIRDTVGNSIFEVTGEAKTNTMSFPFSLELISGSETDGTWQGSWENQDEYCLNYGLTIIAKSASGTSKVELTFR
jgi:prepilin-type N-terminal cleavage/methylation domain-containing protein